MQSTLTTANGDVRCCWHGTEKRAANCIPRGIVPIQNGYRCILLSNLLHELAALHEVLWSADKISFLHESPRNKSKI
jgi:hypothetical protein